MLSPHTSQLMIRKIVVDNVFLGAVLSWKCVVSERDSEARCLTALDPAM